MYCNSCGRYIDPDGSLDATSALCPYCGAPPQATSPALPDMPPISDVFHPVEDDKPREMTFREFVRSRPRLRGYLSYEDYRASKVAAKRDVAARLFANIVVWAIVLGLGFLAMHFFFHLL